jgi:hypothetical protein
MRTSVSTSLSRLAAQASNSWPSVMGTASWSCVRPILSTLPNSWPLRRNAPTRRRSSSTSWVFSSAIATCSAVG